MGPLPAPAWLSQSLLSCLASFFDGEAKQQKSQGKISFLVLGKQNAFHPEPGACVSFLTPSTQGPGPVSLILLQAASHQPIPRESPLPGATCLSAKD